MLTRKAYSDIITFTRASSGGRFNAQGVYEMVPANTPRIDYDTVTGECRGLLIEEQRTNLWAQGNTASGQSGCTRTGTWGPSSYSPHPWKRATITTDKTEHHIEFYFGAFTVGTTYTFSLDIRRGNFDTIALWNSVHGIRTTIDLSSGAAGTPANCTVLPLGNGAYRFSWWFTAMATSHGFRVYFNASGGSWTGNGTDYFDYANPQLEVGSFPTSYIPTSGSQVTRAADAASINTLSPWYNKSEGCLYCEASQPMIFFASKSAVSLSDSGGGNRITLYRQAPGPVNGYILPAANTAWLSTEIAVANVTWKNAISWAGGLASHAVNGSLHQTNKAYSLNTALLNTLVIGNAHTMASEHLNGHIKRIKYFPKSLDNTTLQQITS